VGSSCRLIGMTVRLPGSIFTTSWSCPSGRYGFTYYSIDDEGTGCAYVREIIQLLKSRFKK